MPSSTTPFSRAVAALWVGSGVTLLGAWALLSGGPSGHVLERASYDSLHRWAGEAPFVQPTEDAVVLVYLDPASYRGAGLDPLRPWPRELHAEMVRRLSAGGAKAIVFDILFAGPGPSAEADADLEEAIRASGRVVLAGEYDIKSSHWTGGDAEGVRSRTWAPPFGPFAAAAAGWGLAVLGIDDDLVVRRQFHGLLSEGRPSLAAAAAAVVEGAKPVARPDGWMRYYGPALGLAHVSYAEAFELASGASGFFRDKIVFIGARTGEGGFDQLRDEFRSPFHSWGRKEFFMPGVEVHATQCLNLLRGDGLRRLPQFVEALVLVGVAGLLSVGLLRLRPVRGAVAAMAVAGLAFGGSVAAFRAGVWFPWMIVAALQVPVAWAGALLVHSMEWYRTRRRLETEQRAAEARIREQAALIDAARDAIAVQDLAGGLSYANPGALRLFGHSAEALRDPATLAELFRPDSARIAVARAETLRTGAWQGELRLQPPNGAAPVLVASRWTLIRDDQGQPSALLWINTDVTESRAVEAQLLRTQRMNTVGALASGMAHDLNNALAPVLMGAQLLRRKATDDEARRTLQMIEESAHRGAGMVRQVLHFARGREAGLETVDVAGLVRELERLVRDSFPAHIEVVAFLPSDLRAVPGHPTELQQVLLNLAVNARDAMPNGGRLTFAADNVALSEADAAAIPGARAGKFVSVLVSDSGAGLTPEVKARLFEPFFTTKPEGVGTGLGLATVQRIVRTHGGFLRIESEPGQGAAFEVFLPVAEAPTEAARPAGALPPPRGQGETLLVVDDELAMRELLVDGLGAEGYRVLAAPNGAVALQLLRDHGGDIRLLLTDHAMPEMDGAALVREARALRPELPVILTGATAPSSEPSGTGPLIRLPKPFALDDLLEGVARALGKPVVPS